MTAQEIATATVRVTDKPMVTKFGLTEPREDVDGVPWDEAPIPRGWHRCKAQTSRWWGLMLREQCACGGQRLLTVAGPSPWSGRNSRRRSRPTPGSPMEAPK